MRYGGASYIFFLQFSLISSILRAGMRVSKARLMDEVLTVREVAALLKINEKTAYKLAARGEIPGFKVGGSWRFEKTQLEEWMKLKTSKAQSAG